MFTQYIPLSRTGKTDGKIQIYTAQELKKASAQDVLSLHDIIMGRHVDIALEQMYQDGLLSFVIPGINDVVTMRDVPGKHRFKDLWWHTKLVVLQSKPKLEIRWAALFHDFGKPSCFTMENGKVAFHNHEHASVKYFKEFARKFRIFTPEQYNKISFLIYNLGYVEAYTSNWTESAVRRFAKDTGPNLEYLLLLSRADTTSSNPKNRRKVQFKISELSKRIKEVQAKDAVVSLLPKGIGNAIIDIGLTGKDIGAAKDYLEGMIKAGTIEGNKDIQYYMQYLSASNHELWLWQNKEALASVQRGLAAPDPTKPRKHIEISTLPDE